MDLWGRLAGIAISKRYALGTRSANYATALPSTLTKKPLLLASLAPEALKKRNELVGQGDLRPPKGQRSPCSRRARVEKSGHLESCLAYEASRPTIGGPQTATERSEKRSWWPMFGRYVSDVRRWAGLRPPGPSPCPYSPKCLERLSGNSVSDASTRLDRSPATRKYGLLASLYWPV